jgi:hypothetical protein
MRYSHATSSLTAGVLTRNIQFLLQRAMLELMEEYCLNLIGPNNFELLQRFVLFVVSCYFRLLLKTSIQEVNTNSSISLKSGTKFEVFKSDSSSVLKRQIAIRTTSTGNN